MDRVLSSAELLNLIFNFTDQATEARCARVCKIWFEVAIKELWRTVYVLQQILSILAPIQKDESGTYKFIRLPTRNDWSRYYKYASNVKHLYLLDDTWVMSQILHEVARSRTQLHLFPNLIDLYIAVKPYFVENATLFLRDGLRSINAYVGEENPEHLGTFLDIVADRIGSIEKFNLNGNIRVRPYEGHLLRVFHNQRAIRHIIFPIYFNSSSMITSLAQLRNLRVIALCYSDGGETSEQNRRDVLDFNPNLSVDAFPNLTDLYLTVGIQDMKRFMSMKYAPENISTLCFVTIDFQTADALRDCLATIGARCKSLQNFTLAMTQEAAVTSYRTTYTISFDTLAPLLKLRKMVQFDIDHPKPLVLTAQDMDKIARSWPCIKTLNLNPQPLILDEPQFGLSVLQSFAQYCPELCGLGLYLDTTSDFLDSSNRYNRLETLEDISFGASRINDPESVAIYLSELLPASCDLYMPFYWVKQRRALGNLEFTARLKTYKELWSQVAKLLPVLVRAFERNRCRCQVEPE